MHESACLGRRLDAGEFVWLRIGSTRQLAGPDETDSAAHELRWGPTFVPLARAWRGWGLLVVEKLDVNDLDLHYSNKVEEPGKSCKHLPLSY